MCRLTQKQSIVSCNADAYAVQVSRSSDEQFRIYNLEMDGRTDENIQNVNKYHPVVKWTDIDIRLQGYEKPDKLDLSEELLVTVMTNICIKGSIITIPGAVGW